MSTKSRNSLMLQATASYVDKIKTFAEELQINFTDYQQSCVVNAVRTITPMLEKNGYTWQSFGVDNIITVLQQTAFLELNPSATPNECYYIVRKDYDKKTKSYLPPVLEFNIEGAGNDIILRKFGQDVMDLKSYIVYEGDEFTEGFMNGWDLSLPTYRRKFLTNKPMKVVYLIKKTNGEIDVQYADTLDVMKSLLANAKQNKAEEKLLRQLAKLGLYEILEDEKWLDYKISKTYGKNNYTTPLFNPSYTSPISMYSMIERKLRNHATRKYPKNFNHKEVSALYEDTFDEKYNEKGEMITAEEQVQIANEEIDQKQGKEPLIKEVVEVVEVVKVENDDRPTLEVEEVVEEETKSDEFITHMNNEIAKEEIVETVEKVEEKVDSDEPDWFN
jgi:hypothetical protein